MIRQYTFIRQDLNLSAGAACVQSQHAILSLIFKVMNKLNEFTWEINNTHDGVVCAPGEERVHISDTGNANLEKWFNKSWVKVCLAVRGSDDLFTIADICDKNNITYALIRDYVKGRNAKEYTCLAIEPIDEKLAKKLFRRYPLY